MQIAVKEHATSSKMIESSWASYSYQKPFDITFSEPNMSNINSSAWILWEILLIFQLLNQILSMVIKNWIYLKSCLVCWFAGDL